MGVQTYNMVTLMMIKLLLTNLDLDSFDGIVDTIEMNLIFELDKKRTRDNQQLTSLLSVGLG
jgi:hypothetical protein